MWTIIPAIVLTGFITYGLLTWSDVMNMQKNDDPMVIELYAQQFNWKARYAGEDGVLGDANVRFLQDFDGKNLVGIDPTDRNGDDDIVVQELHLPVNREVVFRIRSQDVLHSAFMPHFRAQMNVVPGTVSGNPAASAAFLPILPVCSPSWETQPAITSSISFGSVEFLLISSSITRPSISTAWMPFSKPPLLPIGVRSPSTINAVFISIK